MHIYAYITSYLFCLGSDLSLISVLYGSGSCGNYTSTPEIAMQVVPLSVSKITAEHNAIFIFIFQICQDTQIARLITWISVLGLERQKSRPSRGSWGNYSKSALQPQWISSGLPQGMQAGVRLNQALTAPCWELHG